MAADKANVEIPFHISFRFMENEIVRNNRTLQGFGIEEKQPSFKNIRNPFVAGKSVILK